VGRKQAFPKITAIAFPMKKKMRILIADDHEIVRESVRVIVEREPGWEVCGVAANGREAVDFAKKLKPDAIILDLKMPGLDGLEAVKQIKRAVPETEILVLSAHESEDLIEQVLESGAKSCVRKAEVRRLLVPALKSLQNHKTFLTDEVSAVPLPFAPREEIPGHPIRVLLADDHALVRAGIRSLLEKMPGVEVVGEASNGREALEMVKAKLPNLVLMDIAMAELGGLEALPRITKDFTSVKVVILSGYAKEEYVSRALRSGASGYMLKDAATVELELVIKSVAQGKTYLSPLISRIVIDRYLERGGGELSPLEQLTSRQREILQMIAEGKSTKAIASTLEIGIKTVEAHRLQLMGRLDIHDVPGLVRYAIRNGIVDA
jgi:DNA-binding NarL/FixJ family response regulator